MHYDRPIVLSIAGFDPSGGAGILADVKTLEQHRCLGFSVVTALTIQTEDKFLNADWISLDKIQAQLQPLLEQYKIAVIKIGLIENFRILALLVQWIKRYSNDIKIIWDPVMTSSSGFIFHQGKDDNLLMEILKELYLVTPNLQEIVMLTGIRDDKDAASRLSDITNILLKGGHSETERGTDYLWEKGAITVFTSKLITENAKHGSGCILSSAIAANIAHGNTLNVSCKEAKRYIETILNSNNHLLAYHHV